MLFRATRKLRQFFFRHIIIFAQSQLKAVFTQLTFRCPGKLTNVDSIGGIGSYIMYIKLCSLQMSNQIKRPWMMFGHIGANGNMIRANSLFRVLAGGGWGNASFCLSLLPFCPSQQPEKKVRSNHTSFCSTLIDHGTLKMQAIGL